MKKIFSLLFDTFFEYKNDRLGKLERKYKVYKILYSISGKVYIKKTI